VIVYQCTRDTLAASSSLTLRRYEAMLSDEGVATVGDLVKAAATASGGGEDGGGEGGGGAGATVDAVSRYLEGLGFSLTHADAVASAAAAAAAAAAADCDAAPLEETALDAMKAFADMFEESDEDDEDGAAAATSAATRAAAANVHGTSGGAGGASSVAEETIRSRSAGGFYDPAFLKAVAPLYDMHMGAENLG